METTEKRSEMKTRLIVGLRWIAVLPAAVLAGAIMPTILLGIGPYQLSEDFLSRIFLIIASSWAGAAAFTFCGALVAPSHQKLVLFVLGGFGLMVSGCLIFYFLLRSDYWGLLSGVATAVALGVCMYNADAFLE